LAAIAQICSDAAPSAMNLSGISLCSSWLLAVEPLVAALDHRARPAGNRCPHPSGRWRPRRPPRSRWGHRADRRDERAGYRD
jgi:hypothetical protein